MKLIETIETFISGDWGNESHTEDTPCEVFCVRGADIEPIKNQDYNHIPKRYISKRSYENKLLQVGDIIVEKSGGSPTQSTGRVCLITPNLIEKLQSVDCSNFCAAFRVKKEWDAEYIYLYIQHFYNMGAFFNFEGKTSGIKNLQLEQAYQAIEIKPISIAEQKKLAKTIRTIDGKTAINRSINQNLEAMAKQLYDYWFVQFDFPNENGRPYKSFGGKMVWNEKQRKYIPEYWEVKSLSNWLEIKSGFPFKSETYKPIGRYKIITIKNVQDGELVTSGCDYVNDIPSRAKDYISLQIGDRLISLTGNCGRLCVVCEENLLLNQRVGLLCCDAIYLEYFYNFLNSGTMRTVIDNLANGAAQANLSPVELCKTDCFIPPIDILLSYNRKVNAIRKAIVQNNQEISQLAKQRDELLPLLMNGQVSVNSDLSVYKKRRGKVPSSIQNDVSDI